MNKDDVLQVAVECGFQIDGYVGSQWLLETDDVEPLERFAAAMYGKGAADMKELAVTKCRQLEDDYLEHRIFPEECDMTQAAAACGSCANVIDALPITPTNTEGEQ